MNNFCFRLVILFCGVFLSICCPSPLNAQAEHPPFREDIQAFKKMDSLHPPVKHSILFVGSSSFTKWTDVQDYFPGFPIINRGFGGSSLPDLIRYVKDIILPYQPRQIVIYCGENDLAASDAVSAQIVFDRFVRLFRLIREGLPEVPLIYISIKPSPSRHLLMPKFVEANRRINEFIHHQQHAIFVDVYPKMLNASGEPIDSLFLGDKLHMNASGYAIWKKEIGPYLLK